MYACSIYNFENVNQEAMQSHLKDFCRVIDVSVFKGGQ